MDAAPSPRTPREPVPSVPPPSRLGFGFVSPLVSPARKLASTHPSLFSPFGRETVPAQSSTGFLAQHPRLFPQRLQVGIPPVLMKCHSNCRPHPLTVCHVPALRLPGDKSSDNVY